MPRTGRRKGKKKRDASLNGAKARFWQRCLKNAEAAKAEYNRVADEVVEYFKANHEHLFKSKSVRDHFMSFEDGACVSIPKVAQARNTLGPHLYPTNPTRTVTPRTSDKVMLGHARVLSAYLNYTPGEAGLAIQKRRGIDDGLLRGRGFLMPGVDETLDVVTSAYVSSSDVLIDPDVRCMEDASWVAIRREQSLWELKRDLPKADHWRLASLEQWSSPEIEPDDFETRRHEEGEPTTSNTRVVYWEIYSKMGSGIRGRDFGGFERHNDDLDFVRIDVSHSCDVPLFEGEWEVPVYLDKEWPLVPLDPVETLDTLWPVSVMGQVLSLQKAIDLLSSLNLNSCKHRGRVIVLGDAKLDTAGQQAIKNGGMSEYVSVKLEPGQRLSENFHVMSLGQNPQEISAERAFYEREIETTTGVTSALTGATAATQDRSATASQLRAQGASTRVTDLKLRVEEWSARVARMEALYVTLNLDAEDVERVVSVNDIGLFMIRLEVPGGAVVPLRDRRTEAELERDQSMQAEPPLTLQSIYPAASTFFESEEEAVEVLIGFVEELRSGVIFDRPDGGRIMELFAQIGDQFDDPGSLIAPVTVEDVWREVAGMSPRELMREYSYELATGSMPMLDPGRKQELVSTLLNQVAPVALQIGDYEAFNAILEEHYEATETPQSMRVRLQPPAPPPGPPPTGPGGASAPAPQEAMA